jgi:hypothetical protein
MYITLPHVETSISIDGGELYIFNTVLSIEVENGLTKKLLNSPQDNSDGLVMTDGLTGSMSVKFIVREVPNDIMRSFESAWKDDKRVSIDVVDLQTGKNLSINKGLIVADPDNVKIEESDSVYDVALDINVTRRNFSTTVKELG